MFDTRFSDEMEQYARRQVGRGAFGRRGIADGTVEQQVIGLIGQIVVHDALGLPWPKDVGRSDGGVDIWHAGLAIDVKTMGRKVPPHPLHVHNYMELQAAYPADVLIFCSLNRVTQVVTVCGWLRKDDLLKRARFYPKGTRRERADGSSFILRSSVYEIQNRQLVSPRSSDHLIIGLEWLACEPQPAKDSVGSAALAGRR